MIRYFLIGLGSAIVGSSVVFLISSHQLAMLIPICIGICLVAGSIKNKG